LILLIHKAQTSTEFIAIDNGEIQESPFPSPKNMKKVTIIGAGVTGCALAMLLSRAGFQIEIIDRRSESGNQKADAGSSGNLTISKRGLDILETFGLAEKVKAAGNPLYGRSIHPNSNEEHFQAYTYSNEPIYSISRFSLESILLQATVAQALVEIRFGITVESISLLDKKILISSLKGGIEVLAYSLLLGADGPGSILRKVMSDAGLISSTRTHFSYDMLEITVPVGTSGRKAMRRDALHVFPIERDILFGFPMRDGSFNGLFFTVGEGREALERGSADCASVLKSLHPVLQDYFPTTSIINRKVNRPSIFSCSPWHWKGEVALVGDAAHEVLPFYGQGLAISLEDCLVLAECLASNREEPEAGLLIFENARKREADSLSIISNQNFHELLDVSFEGFQQGRKAAMEYLADEFPELFKPIYSLVAFSRVSFDEIRKIKEIQDFVLAELGDFAAFNYPDLKARVAELLKNNLHSVSS
jgi:kynurenine 3-monooxygenase